jgi:DNA polymerase-1
MPEPQKPAIFLLDTMSFIFRAYHAMMRSRPMSTRSGIPTAATYVFVNMLNKLRTDFAPQYFAAIFDLSGPVFRDERAKAMPSVRKFNIKTQSFDEIAYQGYKANRTEMPRDLSQQVPYIRAALEAMQIPMLAAEGFEADDVIGTISCEAAKTGHPVFIVTSDKDMMQLVDEHVRVLNPQKDNLVIDHDKVIELMGVEPKRVIDVMALRGDSIDNIPGAPGIGDKGSIEIIQQFGSVENALDRASEVKRKTYRESLENNRDTILLSKELVTIHTTVPIEIDFEAMRTTEPDVSALRKLYSELEFTSLLKDLGPATRPLDGPHTEYLLQPTASDIAALLQAARANGVAVAMGVSAPPAEEAEDADAEESPAKATGLLNFAAPAAEKAPALQVGLAAVQDKALRIDLASDESIQAALADPAIPKSVCDWKSIEAQMEDAGLALNGVRDDLALYSYLINPTHSSHTLPDIVARFGHRTLEEQDTPGALAAAAEAILRLTPALRAEVEAADSMRVYEQIDLPLVSVLRRIERSGVRVDLAVLDEMSSRLQRDMTELAESIFERSGHRFNINSPKQLGDVLFNKMGLPKPLKYGKGKVISTAQDVLEDLAALHEVPRLVLEFRQLAKLKSNYIDVLPLLADPQTHRVHTTYNQVGTSTGRLSSTNPNLQNVPVRTALGREIRAAFIAAEGNVLLSADYSQIELRLMAHFSQDPLLVNTYTTGGDIHTLTASEVFGVPAGEMTKETRNRAKAINFGIVYGISPFGLAAQGIGIDQHQARQYIDRYFERYKGVRQFIDRTLEETRRSQTVRTMLGRVRPIPDILSSNANLRGFAERTAVNTPLQGTAADLIKLAMIRLDATLRERKLQTKMTLQVHDELLFDVPEDEVNEIAPLVKETMEQVADLSVPLVADCRVGPNWRDLDPV